MVSSVTTMLASSSGHEKARIVKSFDLPFPGSAAGTKAHAVWFARREIKVPPCWQQEIATWFCRGRFIQNWSCDQGLATADLHPNLQRIAL